MIRQLRKKFILIAMLSTFIVLSAIMGTVNISGYLKMAARADDMTSVLGINDGKFPGNGKEEMEAAGNENPPDVAVGKREDIFETEASRNFSPEAPYETRYFTVILDDGGEISSCDLNHIAAVDEDMALEYGKTVSGKKSETGFCGIYRYRVIKDDGQTKCIFLDCAREISGFRVTAVSSIVMSFLGLAAVLVLVIFFSQIVFLPVEESIRKQKQFITDASHELKTPLTIIDANTEVIEMETGENQWTKSTRKQIQRLSGMVQQLVALSRLDENRDIGEKTEFSASDAVLETVQPYEAPVRTGGKEMEQLVDEGILFTGNERDFRQLVGILVDNAVKYTPEGGKIRIALKKKGKKCQLEIFNDAEELPVGKLDVLFERFYRLDSSRNSSTGGSGIGLSVAKAIVRAHKGKITAESPDGKIMKITVII